MKKKISPQTRTLLLSIFPSDQYLAIQLIIPPLQLFFALLKSTSLKKLHKKIAKNIGKGGRYTFIFQTILELGSQTSKDQMEDVVCLFLPGAAQTDWI